MPWICVHAESTRRLPGALRKTSENNIFKPNKPVKPRTSGAKSEWPSRCNAFAIARFLVYIYICGFSTKLYYFHSRISSLTLSEQLYRTLCECQYIVSACQISPKQDHPCEVVISIFQMATMESQDSGTLCKPNFNEVSESTTTSGYVATYLNSTSGFDYDMRTFIAISFCICLPNFIKIEPPAADV